MRATPVVQSLTEPLLSPLVSAISGVFGNGWNPISLFTSGQQGYAYDLNDLSTLYLDSAGTTAASVNGAVGLVLDKSKGLALGAELAPATNSVVGWTPNANCTIATVGGELEITATAVGVCVADYNVAGTSAGKNYLLTAVCRQGQVAGSGASVAIAFGSVPYSQANTTTTNASVRVFKVSAAGAEILRIRFDSTVIGQKAYFSLLSFKELPGNHAYQATSGSRPILRGTPMGSNLVTNGDFATDTVWTKGTGWAIAAGVATKTAGTATAISQSYAVVAGNTYRFTYTVSGATGGTCAAALAGGTQVTGALLGTNGTRVEYLTANAGNTFFAITSNSLFNGSIDNIEVVDISAGSVQAPYALRFDGVDDFLQTASVDFTATDKMTVCHGVRKLSDAALGVVVELSASVFANPGAFWIAAPDSAASNVQFRAGGTATANLVRTGLAAPTTLVVCGQTNIVGDSLILRVNQSETTSGADQGTGNLGNYVLYFGRRAGTSNPFNGLMFSAVCVGKTVSAIELANIERWVNTRTGAY